MRRIFIVALVLVFAIPQAINAAPANTEPEPTPVIEAPQPPPLAIGLPGDEVEEVEEEGRSLLLMILIIVVSSATTIAVGFYVYRKIRQFLANRKKKKAEQEDKK